MQEFSFSDRGNSAQLFGWLAALFLATTPLSAGERISVTVDLSQQQADSPGAALTCMLFEDTKGVEGPSGTLTASGTVLLLRPVYNPRVFDGNEYIFDESHLGKKRAIQIGEGDYRDTIEVELDPIKPDAFVNWETGECRLEILSADGSGGLPSSCAQYDLNLGSLYDCAFPGTSDDDALVSFARITEDRGALE